MALRLVAIVLLVGPAVLAPVIGAAAGAPTVEQADLVVDQPHYIGSDVDRETENGTAVYVAKGASIELYPQNFDADRVVNYGVTTANGSLSYDRQTGAFTLTPEQTGTYEVFFIVERPVVVDAANATGNATGQQTVQRQYRYEARIRVTGGVDIVHRQEGSLADQEVAAQNWQEFNQTIHQRGLVGPAGVDNEVEQMIDWYELHPTNNPLSALTGGIVGYIIIGVTSTAVIVWILFFGGHTTIVNRLRRQIHMLRAVMAEEGTAKDAVAAFDARQNRQNAQTEFWEDLDGFDDLIGEGFRETFGANTLHDGGVELTSALTPRQVVLDRLQAMGHDGYVAVVDEWAVPDGGDGGEVGDIESVHLAHEDDVADDAETIDLASASSEQVALIRDELDSWDCDPLREFDFTRADYDASELESPYDSADLDTLVDRTKVDLRYFEDETQYTEYLQEFVESLEDGPETDPEGRLDETRWVLNHFLKIFQRLDDRHGYPIMRFYREALERALQDFDAEEQAQQAINRVESGVGPATGGD